MSWGGAAAPARSTLNLNARVQGTRCVACGVNLDAWHILVECSRIAADRIQALMQCERAASSAACEQGVPAPPSRRVDLATAHGRMQFFCLCLGEVWLYDPACTEVSEGEGVEAKAHTAREAAWQSHRRAAQPARRGLGPRAAGSRARRSSLTTAVLPPLMRFAEHALRDTLIHIGVVALPNDAHAAERRADMRRDASRGTVTVTGRPTG